MYETYLVIWLTIFVICLLLEATTMGLTTIWFAFGALVALLISFFGIGMWGQIIIFFIVSIGLLYFTRPIAIKVLKIGHVKTNYESMAGRKGVVTEEIDNIKARGQVKVDGQIWSAKSTVENIIKKDSEIKVLEVKGVKLLVEEISKN